MEAEALATAGRLAGKAAIVTGASRGIGFATAQALAARGAQVALLARTREPLEQAARKIGPPAFAVVADVSQPDSVDRAFGTALERMGRLDILVNNAGIGRLQKVEGVSNEDLRAQVDTNFLGMVYCVRAAIPLMRRAGSGEIVNLSSDSIRNPFPYLSVYAATKGAVEVFSQALRRELRPDSIRTTLVRAGPSLTEFASQWNPKLAQEAFQYWSEHGFLDTSGGVLQPAQVADSIAYALSLPLEASVEVLEVRPT